MPNKLYNFYKTQKIGIIIKKKLLYMFFGL